MRISIFVTDLGSVQGVDAVALCRYLSAVGDDELCVYAKRGDAQLSQLLPAYDADSEFPIRYLQDPRSINWAADLNLYFWDERDPYVPDRVRGPESLHIGVLRGEIPVPPIFDGVICRHVCAYAKQDAYQLNNRAWWLPDGFYLDRWPQYVPRDGAAVGWFEPVGQPHTRDEQSIRRVVNFMSATLPRAELRFIVHGDQFPIYRSTLEELGRLGFLVDLGDEVQVQEAAKQCRFGCYFDGEKTGRSWLVLLAATGLPMVVDHGECAIEYLRDGETGFICDNWELCQLACRRLWADPALVERMGDHAKEFARANFCWSVLGPRHQDLLGRLQDRDWPAPDQFTP